jgi:hypothetical protein
MMASTSTMFIPSLRKAIFSGAPASLPGNQPMNGQRVIGIVNGYFVILFTSFTI